MILFATSYDPPAAVCAVVARRTAHRAAVALLEVDATRGNLLGVLETHKSMPLLALSHGNRSALIGQDETVAIGVDDSAALVGRTLFIFACETLQHLGHRAQLAGCDAYWGYPCPISLPPLAGEQPDLVDGIMDLICHRALPALRRNEVTDTLSGMKRECEKLAKEIAEREADIGWAIAAESMSACHMIWSALGCLLPTERAVVWHPDGVKPDC